MLEGNFLGQWLELERQLDKIIESSEIVEDEVEYTEPPVEQLLSEEARQLLCEASEDNRGMIIHIVDSGGDEVSTNGKAMNRNDSARGSTLEGGD